MSAKLLPILILLFALIGCQADKPASVSKGDSATFEPNFDTAPVVYDLFPPNIAEDTESGTIYLSYSDAENHMPSSCQVFNRQYVNVTQPCICSFGLCSVRVKPFADYNGAVSFQYSVTANGLTSLGATVSFYVTPLSDAPIAHDRTISLPENTTYTSNGTISFPHLSGTDPDGNPVTCTKVTDPDPLAGTAIVNSDCSYSFTPVTDFEGTTSFTFKVNDGTTDSAPATVTVNVLHVNVDPVSSDVTLNTYQNTFITFTPVFTDTDPSDPWETVIISAPTKGTLSGSGLNRTYTPNSNYIGTDSFTYQVFDGEGHSNLSTVTVTVMPKTIYLRSSGDDLTGALNDPSRPFLTAQAAADAASAEAPDSARPVVIDVGAGNFGNLSFGYNFGEHISWKGLGAGASVIGNITLNGSDGAAGNPSGDIHLGEFDGAPGTDAFDLRINSPDFSVSFGNITANGGNGGAHVPDPVNYETRPGNPGEGGNLILQGIFGTINAKGGNGHGGGKGGTVRLMAGSTSLDIDVSGGLDMCTAATQCPTSQGSGSGGNVQIDATATVTGNIISKGGENLGNNGPDDDNDVYEAGKGGSIVVLGTVNGNIEATGGDSFDSDVGEGGSVDIKSSGVVTGDINVQTGQTSGAGSPNYAGYVEISGTVRDIIADSFAAFGGAGGEVVVRGTARDIFVQSYDSSCTTAAAGVVTVYIPGTVRNIYADGGNRECATPTSGYLNIYGRVTGSASVNGGPSVGGLPAGKAGDIRLNNGSNVNILTAIGGTGSVGACDGGDGGTITTYPGSTYDIANFSVAGGGGCGSPGDPGQIIEN